ncbi:undecaprenyldiphospho-muramoylpentapeptide beta-N-acetylglucosaminyltransferase [Intrasporangium flavum]|uniref:undecaprenyldiphospho-muramoylpentapeptide beta-N-acetylglucosaminyltransferase n=1 Tax=Intrasporangium flavum TaxID=1428657 RepID=UPI00096C5FE3|nr:undecaprenyldiphospho-muramoylpentapeptide beta-N-acetylglucosaminyltransferase [Intrasporangium flavum]
MIHLSSPTSVLLAGGGSAGHVSPLLSLADALRRRHPDVRVTALGTSEGLEARLVPAHGLDLRVVPKVPLPRRPSGDLLRLPGRLKAAVDAAGAAIDDTGAQVVVGFGGYVSTPAYLAARRRGVPVVIHEQNARAGLANRLGARFAAHVATTFAVTSLPNATRIGMPLRREVSTLDRPGRRAEALALFGLDASYPTVLVTGGSLGAQRLNDAFRANVERLSAAGVQVLHVTGLGKEFDATVPEGGAPYVVVPYADRMELAYAAADLVVARAGANTVCELTAVGLPAVYVPLPVGNGEQRLNAADVVATGGGLLVDDADLTPEYVGSQVLALATDRPRLERMAAAAAALGERAADERLADMVDDAAAASTRAGVRR